MVVSWPPCWLAVLVKTLPTFPTRAPRAHRPPVWSRKLRICAAMLPKRVGVPKIIASASGNCSTRASGTRSNALRAALAPLFFQSLAGNQFRHLEHRHLDARDL